MLNNVVNETVTAWDGGTIYDYTTNALKAGPEPDLYLKNYTWQHTWYKYVKKDVCLRPQRERIGERKLRDVY